MTSLDSKTQIVVVGNGMVGHHFVEQLPVLMGEHLDSLTFVGLNVT